MSVEWIEYKGKLILYANYKGLDAAENRQQLEVQMNMIAQSPTPVLMLVNVEGAVMTPENTQYTKDRLIELGPKIIKSALTGVTGFKPVIVEGIGRAAKDLTQQIFENEADAKEWLVS